MKQLELTENSLISRSKNILFSKLDDEILGIDSQAGCVYSMNETANCVWELISSPISFKALTAQLCSEFEVDENVCMHEVMTLLQKLFVADLIQIQDARDQSV